jgi:hypothetical protein
MPAAEDRTELGMPREPEAETRESGLEVRVLVLLAAAARARIVASGLHDGIVARAAVLERALRARELEPPSTV